MGRPQQQDFNFEAIRPKLFAVAYRMLGSVSEAEDIVQDSFLRWQKTDSLNIRTPEAYLVRVTTRLCLDYLKSARARRESYVGEWLPEPMVIEEESEYPHEDVSLALLYALERLSPLERAAFILHDIFDYSFSEVAEQLGREPASCRQLAARGRKHLRNERPRFPAKQEDGQRLAEAFFKAAYEGDEGALGNLLSKDVSFISDGGGKIIATINPILGQEKVIRLLTSLARKGNYKSPARRKFCMINHLPGVISQQDGEMLQTAAFEISEGKIVRILVTRNPEKLRHLSLD